MKKNLFKSAFAITAIAVASSAFADEMIQNGNFDLYSYVNSAAGMTYQVPFPVGWSCVNFPRFNVRCAYPLATTRIGLWSVQAGTGVTARQARPVNPTWSQSFYAPAGTYTLTATVAKVNPNGAYALSDYGQGANITVSGTTLSVPETSLAVNGNGTFSTTVVVATTGPQSAVFSLIRPNGHYTPGYFYYLENVSLVPKQ